MDIDECEDGRACGKDAKCTNELGGYRCECPPGSEGDAYRAEGCRDTNECARSPCGRDALCSDMPGTFRCACPPGFQGDPMVACIGKFSNLNIILYIVMESFIKLT